MFVSVFSAQSTHAQQLTPPASEAPSADPRQPTQAEAAEARALFEQGLTAADAERWGEAVLFFQRSLAFVPRASTQLNLGNALVRMGRVREARRALGAFLEAADPQRDADRIPRARAMLAEAQRTMASLRVRVQGPDGASYAASTVALTLDDEQRTDAQRRAGLYVLEADPGPHRVRARTSDGGSGEASVNALPGGDVEVIVALRFEPVSAARVLDERARVAPEGPPRRALWQSPIFWTALGVVVAAGVTTAVVFTLERPSTIRQYEVGDPPTP